MGCFYIVFMLNFTLCNVTRFQATTVPVTFNLLVMNDTLLRLWATLLMIQRQVSTFILFQRKRLATRFIAAWRPKKRTFAYLITIPARRSPTCSMRWATKPGRTSWNNGAKVGALLIPLHLLRGCRLPFDKFDYVAIKARQVWNCTSKYTVYKCLLL